MPVTVEVRFGPVASGYAELLSGIEQQRWAAMRLDRSRDEFGTGRAMLRRLAGALTDRPPVSVLLDATCPVCGEPHGRPHVVDPPRHASIAHSTGLVVVAVSDGDAAIGVDLEPVSAAAFEGFDAVALTAREQDLVRTSDDPGRVRTRLWVRKEAVLKAVGDGLRTDPRDLDVGDPEASVRGCRIVDLDIDPDVVAALAVRAEEVPQVHLAADDLTAGEAAPGGAAS